MDLFDALDQWNQAQQQDNAYKTDHDTPDQIVPYHNQAHTDAQRNGSDNTQHDCTDSLGTQGNENGLALHFAAHGQHDQQHNQTDAADCDALLEGTPLGDHCHAHTQCKQDTTNRTKDQGNKIFLTLELRREMNTIQKDLDTMRRRREELSKLFKRLYEDNVLGRVTDEQYRMLAGDYTVEQKALEEQIPEKEARLEKLKAASANVNTFVEKAKQYTAIDELTPELLRLFIQRIEVGERTEKYSRSSHQSIRIVYRDIGTVDSAMEQGEAQPHIAPPLSEVFQLPA